MLSKSSAGGVTPVTPYPSASQMHETKWEFWRVLASSRDERQHRPLAHLVQVAISQYLPGMRRADVCLQRSALSLSSLISSASFGTFALNSAESSFCSRISATLRMRSNCWTIVTLCCLSSPSLRAIFRASS